MSDPTQGPYTVEAFEIKRTMKSQIYFRVVGPTPTGLHSTTQKYAANRLCDRLNAAYKQGQQDKWISVEERLPEPGQRVLCHSDVGSDRIIAYLSIASGFPSEVTHWMPLPPSPPNPEQP